MDPKTRAWADYGDFAEAKVDADSHTIEGVTIIAPGWSKNGRFYSKELLASKASELEGSRAYLNHATKSEMRERPERSVADLAGSYSDVKIAKDGRIVGTLNLVGDHASHVEALALASRGNGKDLLGISISASGKVVEGERDGRKGTIVEDIAHFYSADIVTLPAAGGTFLAASNSDQMTSDLFADSEFEEWRDGNPDHLDRLKKELKTVRQDEGMKERDERIKVLEGKLKEVEVDDDKKTEDVDEGVKAQAAKIEELETKVSGFETAAKAEKMLSESDIPEMLHERIRKRMTGLDEAGQKAVLEDEHETLRILQKAGKLDAKILDAGQGENQSSDAKESVDGAALLGSKMSEAQAPGEAESMSEYKTRMKELAAK